MIILYIGSSLLVAFIAFVVGFLLGVRFDSNADLRHEEWKKYHGIGPLYDKEKQS